MKTLMMICLLMISSVVITEVSGNGKYVDPGELGRCSGPDPPPGCHIPDPKEKSRAPAHDYRRGCSASQHCRPG
ncbi:hypothetical protein Bca52824_021013 [Brassica carinata]|uniref:Uncharacterized protein n=1 Tax=Brassica carinata TaxID=52824 RepID=A0A8X7VUW4_BRACI|nr:hypothetical protein Bca52824_021013 [Brassica carinata]